MLKSIEELKEIHIGRIIKSLIDEREISYSDFAEYMNCERTSIYYLFRSKSIDIEKIIKISKYLHYDIISNVYYQTQVEGKCSSALIVGLSDKQIQELDKYQIQKIAISDLFKEIV